MKIENNLPLSQKEKKGVALLNKAYELALNGIPNVTEPLNNVVYSYLSKTRDREEAIKSFILHQKIKCSTTGFITGLGGLITLPVTLPADMASSLYIELRMIAAIAMIRGYNVHDDQVKTAIFLCLAGNAVGDVIKQAGIKSIEKIVIKKLLPKLTGDIIKNINRKVGFRLLTRAGSKGFINLTKAVPILGGVISGGWNWGEVSLYANYAKKMFNENK